jgi:predicted dehydrogenase
MSSDLRVVLFGYGLAGRVFHSPLISATPGMRITGIVTGNEERRAQAREDHPDVRLFSTSEEALAEPDAFDLAVVAGANVTHFPLAMASIANGWNVVVDKPLAPTAALAEEILDAATAAGVQVHPFQNRRWDSDFLTLQALVASEPIGTPHRFESRIERLRISPRGSWRESADPADLGGVLLDFGAHLVDQAIELLGPIVEVRAWARSVRYAGLAPDDMAITAFHESGAVSELIGSQAAAFGEPRYTLFATRGGIRIVGSDTQEAALRAGVRADSEAWGIEAPDFTATVVTPDASEELSSREVALVRGRWNEYYPSVRDSVLGTGIAPVPVSDVIANMRVLDAAGVSARTGESVRLSPAAAHG